MGREDQRALLASSLAGTDTCLHPPPPRGEGSMNRPTFVLFFSRSNFLYFLGRFHEEREDGPQAKDVNKFVTVVCALGSNHGMIQHLQGTAAGNLLLSAKRKLQLKLFRDRRSFELHYFKDTA